MSIHADLIRIANASSEAPTTCADPENSVGDGGPNIYLFLKSATYNTEGRANFTRTSLDSKDLMLLEWGPFKKVFLAGFPQALEIIEYLENYEKSSMHGKTMGFEKNCIIMEISWNFMK